MEKGTELATSESVDKYSWQQMWTLTERPDWAARNYLVSTLALRFADYYFLFTIYDGKK